MLTFNQNHVLFYIHDTKTQVFVLLFLISAVLSHGAKLAHCARTVYSHQFYSFKFQSILLSCFILSVC